MANSHEESHYLHGTAPDEQGRLSRLNDLLNDLSLRELGLALENASWTSAAVSGS